MRLTKIVALTTIATMAAMAFLGVSSATAEPEHPLIVLCKVAELKCEKNNWDPNPTEIHLETLTAEPPKLLTNLGVIECEKSLAVITLLNELLKLIEGHLLALNLTGNCHLGSTACTVTVNSLGGLSFTPAETKLLAIVKFIELEGRNTTKTVKCGSFLNCTYSAGPETKLEAHSDEQGHFLLLANGTPLVGKGFLCPEAFLDINYHAVNLDAELTLKTGLWIEL